MRGGETHGRALVQVRPIAKASDGDFKSFAVVYVGLEKQNNPAFSWDTVTGCPSERVARNHIIPNPVTCSDKIYFAVVGLQSIADLSFSSMIRF